MFLISQRSLMSDVYFLDYIITPKSNHSTAENPDKHRLMYVCS